MSRTQEIHVTIDAQGNVTVRTQGYPGKACMEASRFLEEALGVAALHSVTPEYYATSTRTTQKLTTG